MDRSDRVGNLLNRAAAKQRLWKRAVIAVGILVVLAQWGRIVSVPSGDFPLHWELGRRLTAGQFIYEQGHDHPYPPFWAVLHAPLSLMPIGAAQALLFPLVIVALATLLWVLHRLTRDDLPLSRDALFWATVVALALSSRFIIRDMLECGVNLAMVALSWLGVSLWMRRREFLGGLSLGLAVAMKCTPALFLAYFLWKRQWKMVAATSVAAAAFSLSPMLWLGPAEFTRAGGYWFHLAWKGVSQSDPSHGVLGPEPVQNISLRPSLARFLMHLPEDHIARSDHPLYVDFLDLSPKTASVVVKAVMLLLLGGLAWITRHRPRHRDDPRLYWECAAVSLTILLYSPITWGQHCVGVIPAFYLIARTGFVHGKLPKWINCLLAIYVVGILGLNRTFVGQQTSWLLDSYHVHTWCLLGLLAITIGCRSKCDMGRWLFYHGEDPGTQDESRNDLSTRRQTVKQEPSLVNREQASAVRLRASEEICNPVPRSL